MGAHAVLSRLDAESQGGAGWCAVERRRLSSQQPERAAAALSACAQVDAQEAARIAGLSTDIAREEAQVAELRRQMQGLEQQAAALQAQIDNAGARDAPACARYAWLTQRAVRRLA